MMYDGEEWIECPNSPAISYSEIINDAHEVQSLIRKYRGVEEAYNQFRTIVQLYKSDQNDC